MTSHNQLSYLDVCALTTIRPDLAEGNDKFQNAREELLSASMAFEQARKTLEQAEIEMMNVSRTIFPKSVIVEAQWTP